ncbi:MAG TPA: YidB family protein [Blastocatellia bacterium]|nr:YidB family protein [Blastocatellia bacterium]
MTILEPIINEVSEQFGLRGKAGLLMTALLTLISNERTGGLQGFLDQFRRAGLGEMVSSWVSRGSNTPVTTEQLERAIGGDTIHRISSNVGAQQGVIASALAFMIPRVVDLLTPEGVVPSRLPAWVSSYLGGAAPRTEPVRTEPVRTEHLRTEPGRPPVEHVRRAETSGSTFLRLLPFLALPLLGFLVYRACSHRPEQVGYRAPAPVTSTPIGTPQVQAPTQVPEINSRFSMVNSGGKIRFSGVVSDEQTKQNILNQLRSAFGAGNINGDINVDSRASDVAWTSNLASALPNLKTSGSEVSFEGNSINVGGRLPENTKSEMVAKLKSIYGDGIRVGSFETAATVAEAGRKASEALSSLKPGFTAEDLTRALNMSIINFASGSAQIPKESIPVLEQSASAIKSAPTGTVIEIGGYTDNVGNPAANQKISQQRADSVRRFFINKGVGADSLVAKGYGDSNPIASNDTEDGRFKNRRIEYKDLK